MITFFSKLYKKIFYEYWKSKRGDDKPSEVTKLFPPKLLDFLKTSKFKIYFFKLVKKS